MMLSMMVLPEPGCLSASNSARSSAISAFASAPGATEPNGSRPFRFSRMAPQRLLFTAPARVPGDTNGSSSAPIPAWARRSAPRPMALRSRRLRPKGR